MDELQEWCLQQRDFMLHSIDMMETKKMWLGDLHPGVGQVDTTADWIEALKARIAELDGLLAEYTGPK